MKIVAFFLAATLICDNLLADEKSDGETDLRTKTVARLIMENQQSAAQELKMAQQQLASLSALRESFSGDEAVKLMAEAESLLISQRLRKEFNPRWLKNGFKGQESAIGEITDAKIFFQKAALSLKNWKKGRKLPGKPEYWLERAEDKFEEGFALYTAGAKKLSRAQQLLNQAQAIEKNNQKE